VGTSVVGTTHYCVSAETEWDTLEYILDVVKEAKGMKLLGRYIGKAVVTGSMLALLLLVSVATLIDFVNEMDDVGNQGYTYLRVVVYILLTMPQRIYELFPFAMLLGGLLSLGNLAANSELVVMRATGVSVGRIIGAAFFSGLILTISIILLGEFVAPVSEQKAKSLRNSSTAQRLTLSSHNGLWAKDGDRFLNIHDVFPDMRLGRIHVFEINDKGQLTEFISAESAAYDGSHWQLSGVLHRQIDSDKITKRWSHEERWERLLSPDLFDVIVVKPRHMSAIKLQRYIRYLQKNGLDSSQYELAFWTRFTIPLAGLVMMLLAMPFVFGSLRSGGAGQRLFMGVLIGVAFHLIYQSFIKLGLVYDASPFIVATLPLLIILFIAFVLISRVK
jgi:lipopolysaccharide export system permease protein